MKSILLLAFFSFHLYAQDVILKNPNVGVNSTFEDNDSKIEIISSGKLGSVILLPGGNQFSLPANFWVTDTAFNKNKKALVMLIKRSSEESPGLWSYACLHIDYSNQKHDLKLSLINLNKINNENNLFKIINIESYPIVEFTIAKTSPKGGRVLYINEKWNVDNDKKVE